MPNAAEHLYVHIPFCPRICPYCAFYVLPADRRQISALVTSLLAERDHLVSSGCLSPHPTTLFLGGGTPSALPTRDLAHLLSGLTEGHPPREVTLEMNPSTVSHEKASLLRAMGVTRVSLGAQAFHSTDLQILGRQHTPERIRRSYEILREAGIPSLNLDLIFGLPDQPLERWIQTLDDAMALGPDHLSCYCLSFEEDTPFFEHLSRGEWHRNPEREELFQRATWLHLAGTPWHRYEVSNYARPHHECLHNAAVWRGENYIGLGPSAVSTWNLQRWKNKPDLAAYLAATDTRSWPRTEEETLTPDLIERERLMFGLRTTEGVTVSPVWQEAFQNLARAGYAEPTDGRWRLTEEGLLRADAIAEFFLP
jgi:oxygen-independent coproporphyrinogen-3 oxidase